MTSKKPRVPRGKAAETPDDKHGSVELKVPQTIRYQIEDPFNFLNMGGAEIVEKTIVAFSEEATRAILSKIEYKAAMGLSTGIGKLVTECLTPKTKKENTVDQNKISPVSTLTQGAICSVVLFAVFMAFFLWFDMGILTLIFALVVIGAFIIAGLREIPKKHIGLHTKFEKREHKYYDEGIHWVFWPVYGFEIVDMRERIIELKEGDRLLKVVAGNAPDASHSLPLSLPDIIDDEFEKKSGVTVLQVIFGEITPVNEELLRAAEKEILENAKSRGEDADVFAQARRVKTYSKITGVKPLEASRTIQAHEGNLKRTEVIVNGTGNADKLLGGIIAAKQVDNTDGKEKKGGK